MSMNCHLSHKLSWEPLVEMCAASHTQHNPHSYHDNAPGRCNCYKPLPARFAHPLKQFTLDLLRLLNEFRASDDSTPEEMQQYDPKVWGEYGLRANFSPSHSLQLGYYESLLWGYMTLNLMIADPKRMPLIVRSTEYHLVSLRCMLGYDDEAHEGFFCRHLGQAFEGNMMKPLTPEVLKILRDHAAMMFRCMYSVTGENKLLDEKRLTGLVFEFFDWKAPAEKK